MSTSPGPLQLIRPQRVAPRSLGGLARHLGLEWRPGGLVRPEVAVRGIAHASQDVQPGDLYVALPGQRTHGARYADDAVARGAVAILTDEDGALMAGPTGVPTLVTPAPRALLGEAAAYVYDFPASSLTVVGVTGTNGKTTVTTLLYSVLSKVQGSAGLVGTIETRVGALVVPSVRTTPEASDLQAILAVMREKGVRSAALEISSHAIAFERVGGLVVDVAGFTNLSQDHQDFHPDMEHYFATKASLFTPGRARRGVVVVDDDWGRRLAAQAAIPIRTLAAVPDVPAHPVVTRADWRVSDIAADGAGSRARLRSPDGGVFELHVPLPGLVNVSNAALTVALAVEAGVEAQAAVDALAAAPMVPGRMELVAGPGGPVVVVDYAHSPDALDTALASLRSTSPAPLVVVVGAGGDRDRSKRAPMGVAAARGADVVIVTDDNPRSEDPAAIRAAVLEGARSVDPARVREVVDRAQAIAEAVQVAGSGTVLLAGKGHEQGQEVAGTVHPFDDRLVARDVLARLARAPEAD